MESIFSFAVWGSLGASVVLGAYLFVQAAADPARRASFAIFATVWWILAGLDFGFTEGRIALADYELLRIVWCGLYAGALLKLLGHRLLWICIAAACIPAWGRFWFWQWPAAATTFTYPVAFGLASILHGLEYRRHQGYASTVLCAYSAASALMCALFLLVMGKGRVEPSVPVLGYAHFAEVTILSVVLGWVQLPRELRGRAPVKVPRGQAVAFWLAVVVLESAIQLGLLSFFSSPPYLYLAGSILQVGVTLMLYFYNRHQLVIFTDNVSELLAQRTASLQAAREELARQNEIQAQRLVEQERELKAKAEVIERQRRLELAAQTTGQAAHDIQNLITPILAHVARLEQKGRSGEEISDVAATLRKQVEHLLDLNGQMLALSRRGRLDLQPINAGELVRELPARFPGCTLAIDCRTDAWVKGSWSQLLRALSNLVTNALETVPGSAGPVIVRCESLQVTGLRRCHLGFLEPGPYVQIDVVDRGPGIPDAILERIFEPFFSSKSGRGRSGSGLGLAIVAAVMDDHKGVLDLATGPGGTRFTLYLPSITVPGGIAEPEQLSGNETVAVADDDSSILEQYGAMLEQAGYTVIRADSGVKLLELLQSRTVDALVLDLKMPRLTGLDTFFGAMHLHPGIRALVHSSFVTSDEATRLRELGVSAILQKPASRLEMLRTLRNVLDEEPSYPRT